MRTTSRASRNSAPRKGTDELNELWATYKENGSASSREALIVHFSPLVKYVAGRVAVGLPPNVEQADLVSYGMFGLIDAIDKFEPERGYKFETYAISRIKGAILDELRSIDWVPRSVRSKLRQIEKAIAKLEALHHRPATDAELSANSNGPTTSSRRRSTRSPRLAWRRWTRSWPCPATRVRR